MGARSISQTILRYTFWSLAEVKPNVSNSRRALRYSSDCHNELKAVQKDRPAKRERSLRSFSTASAYFSCQALTRRAVMTPSTRSMAFNT